MGLNKDSLPYVIKLGTRIAEECSLIEEIKFSELDNYLRDLGDNINDYLIVCPDGHGLNYKLDNMIKCCDGPDIAYSIKVKPDSILKKNTETIFDWMDPKSNPRRHPYLVASGAKYFDESIHGERDSNLSNEKLYQRSLVGEEILEKFYSLALRNDNGIKLVPLLLTFEDFTNAGLPSVIKKIYNIVEDGNIPFINYNDSEVILGNVRENVIVRGLVGDRKTKDNDRIAALLARLFHIPIYIAGIDYWGVEDGQGNIVNNPRSTKELYGCCKSEPGKGGTGGMKAKVDGFETYKKGLNVAEVQKLFAENGLPPPNIPGDLFYCIGNLEDLRYMFVEGYDGMTILRGNVPFVRTYEPRIRDTMESLIFNPNN